jgi:beta-N-acetylhexosaminidase
MRMHISSGPTAELARKSRGSGDRVRPNGSAASCSYPVVLKHCLRRGRWLLVLPLTAVLASCSSASASAPQPMQQVARSITQVQAAPRTTGARHLGLTATEAQETAGEHVIYSYAGQLPPASLIDAIRSGEAAGVILFAANVANPIALRTAIGEMQAAAHASPERVGLLIMTDQEGGLVRRLPGPPIQSEKQIGDSPNASLLAKEAGAGAAANLKAAGINVNLAPVLDVFRMPGDFIDQFQRSYAENPGLVGELGADFITAQQAAGVAATAKHFPGLGSATQQQNTDQGPVRLPLSVTQLRRVDEAPYRAAIRAGVKVIMVSWATYLTLDPQRPAGLSSKIIEGELRQRLHFIGVTITDGIDAGALAHFGGVATRSVLATAAGADLILACATNPLDNSPKIGLEAMHAIARALLDHHLSLLSVQASTERVFDLRKHSELGP